MEHFGPFSVGIAVFVFLAVATVAGIVGDYKKRQLIVEPLKAAIEHGQPLDPALIERLMAPEGEEPMDPLALRVGGIITAFAGVGVAGLAFFIAQVKAEAFYPLLGVGLVAVCVGVGLLVAARVVQNHASARAPQRS
jgi:Domain of unknown function (DUF6249)